MTRPRSTLVSLSDTPWYHVVSRCVRRAFLCGEDAHTGRNFDHRRGWIEARTRQLASVFAIDVAAYAVMSNHYHIVLRVDRQRAEGWGDDEVLERWTQLFTGPLLVRRYLDENLRAGMDEAELAKVHELAGVYRERLYDLSWFVRILNEGIARQANAEEGVKGRFWEGRFKSQALLDEQALLAAMAKLTPAPLLPFDATGREDWAIPFAFEDYIDLIETLGRCVHPKKRGFIPKKTPKLLERLGIDTEAFIEHATSLLKEFGSAIGKPAALIELAARRQAKFLRGMKAANRVFESQAA